VKVYPAWNYRDPAKVYEMLEAMTCQGCAFADAVFGKKLCLKGHTYGRKCKSYRERECRASAAQSL